MAFPELDELERRFAAKQVRAAEANDAAARAWLAELVADEVNRSSLPIPVKKWARRMLWRIGQPLTHNAALRAIAPRAKRGKPRPSKRDEAIGRIQFYQDMATGRSNGWIFRQVAGELGLTWKTVRAYWYSREGKR